MAKSSKFTKRLRKPDTVGQREEVSADALAKGPARPQAGCCGRRRLFEPNAH